MENSIKSASPETEPGVALAEQGSVILDGPNGVAVAMTKEAALETARRLIEAAEEAGSQDIDTGQEPDNP